MSTSTGMVRILGIDPGSRITGWGVVDSDGRRSVHVASGIIRTGDGDAAGRLRAIFDGITHIINTHAPDEVAIERVFLARNADSALKLGQARGAAICAACGPGRPLAEYAPKAIKSAIVGTGAAGKDQVQHMVRLLLKLEALPQADQADALAVALCHAHTRTVAKLIEKGSGR